MYSPASSPAAPNDTTAVEHRLAPRFVPVALGQPPGELLRRALVHHTRRNAAAQRTQGRGLSADAHRTGQRIVIKNGTSVVVPLTGKAAAARAEGRAVDSSHFQPRLAAGERLGNRGPGQFVPYGLLTQPNIGRRG